MSFRRLTLVLSEHEMNALRRAAGDDLRRPQEQAKYILRTALLGNGQPSTNSNTGAIRQDSDAGVVELAR